MKKVQMKPVFGFFNVLISYILICLVYNFTLNHLTIFPFSYPTTFLIICSVCIGTVFYLAFFPFIKFSYNKSYIYSLVIFYISFLILSAVTWRTYSLIFPQPLVVLLLFPAIMTQIILYIRHSVKFSE